MSLFQLRVKDVQIRSGIQSKKEMGDVNSDFISNLPENVTDQILVRLPILDAVRTSVLSTNWRYKWTAMPDLVFHDKSALPYPYNNKDKLIGSIDRVLLLHGGLIHKFELVTSCLPVCSIIDGWILFLSRKNIKKFVLKFSLSVDNLYKLPSCFFSAQQICTLELQCCVLKPPPTFTGFSNLKSLYLKDTKFVDKGGVECLISKCPLLESLTWEMPLYDLGHVNICSPNLKYLCLSCGSFEDICFEKSPLLSDVSIGFYDYITDEMVAKFLRTETRNVVKVLSSLPSLRKFVVQHYFLEFLTASEIPEKLPFTCHHLNNLSLDLDFENVNEIRITLCLLNSSPNLRELEIESCLSGDREYNIENFWEEQTHIDWNMSGLQVVKITGFTGFELELGFIKLLLSNSPLLEMLSIRSRKRNILDREGLKFLKELLTFPRASPKAGIKFFELDEK